MDLSMMNEWIEPITVDVVVIGQRPALPFVLINQLEVTAPTTAAISSSCCNIFNNFGPDWIFNPAGIEPISLD